MRRYKFLSIRIYVFARSGNLSHNIRQLNMEVNFERAKLKRKFETFKEFTNLKFREIDEKLSPIILAISLEILFLSLIGSYCLSEKN